MNDTPDDDLRRFARRVGLHYDRLTDEMRSVLQDAFAEGRGNYYALRAKIGGMARADALTPERRSEIARKAVQARIAKSNKAQRSQTAKTASEAAAKARRQQAKDKRLRNIKKQKPDTNQTP